MSQKGHTRSTFSGKIGFVLSAAGASVGLGNIWRFPYLAAKYGGGIFLLVYILLAMTFGYTMIVAETSIGRMTGKSPVGAFKAFGNSGWLRFGGWINAIIPILIVPYYSVIGGWVVKYLADYVLGRGSALAADGYFSAFISNGVSAEVCFAVFAALTSLFTVISLRFSEVYFGFGFLLGSAVFFLVCAVRLNQFTRRLPYYILSIQPVVAEDRTGIFTELGCFLDKKLEHD